MDKFDVIIIGGGPSGASAALYAARGGLSVCIVHNGISALHKAEKIENYYGVGVIDGATLYERGLAQAAGVGVSVVSDQVTFVSFDGSLFFVSCANGEYSARRLVIATGAARLGVDIEGLSELEGKGVSYCAVCDAFFYRKKRVGVLGAGEFAKHEYSVLSNVTEDVTLFTDGAQPSFEPNKLDRRKIVRALGDGRLSGVLFDDGTTAPLDGLFVAVGVMGSSSLCKSMGVITEKNGTVKTDERGMTNIPGLYAVGDCTAGIRQIGKAVADGMAVGMNLIADIKSDNKKPKGNV